MAESSTAIVDPMHPEHVERQLERILDEDTHKSGVLVRLRGDQDRRGPVLRSASYRMMHRSLSQNARDVLPTAAEDEPDVRRRKSAEMKRFGVLESLPHSSPQRLRSQADQALSALRKSPAVSRHSEHADRGTISEFWTSRTALVELPADDLLELVREVPEIADIYPNRELKVPRVVEPKRLPEKVTDSKVSAWGLVAIGSLAVWGAFGSRGAGVKVGVLDTGVDPDHPDLVGKVSDWAELDATGQLVQGSTAHDTDRHGTHVCGTIAGGDASGKFIGVAPEARLAVGLVLDGQVGGTDAQVLAGLDWARETAKVDILNMSLGGLTLGPEVPSTYSEAILTYVQSGIPVVTAIGNEGSQTSGSPGNDSSHWPSGPPTPKTGARASAAGGPRSSAFPRSSRPTSFRSPIRSPRSAPRE